MNGSHAPTTMTYFIDCQLSYTYLHTSPVPNQDSIFSLTEESLLDFIWRKNKYFIT